VCIVQWDVRIDTTDLEQIFIEPRVILDLFSTQIVKFVFHIVQQDTNLITTSV